MKGIEEIELPSDIIRYAMDDPFIRSLQSNPAEKFPATSRFGCIREILGIQDSDAYKITAFSTVMLIKKMNIEKLYSQFIDHIMKMHMIWEHQLSILKRNIIIKSI